MHKSLSVQLPVAAPLLVLLTLLGAAPRCVSGQSPYRQLAPGVETTIPADRHPADTVSRHDMVELRAQTNLEWTPHYTPVSQTLYAMAKDAEFRRGIWCLQLSFKPLRMIQVDVPQPTGKMQRKLIWYLVYRVTNTGKHLVPTQADDGTFTETEGDLPVRFIPQFVLEGLGQKKAYLDRIIPAAIGPIQQREDPNRRLLNSAEMSSAEVPVSTERADRSVWGVVTWEDIDPQIDFLTVSVFGLTNAYRWTDPPGTYQAGDPPGRGRQFVRKSLQLNFWRPGDQYREHEKEIRFGTPPGQAQVYGVSEGVDHVWVYR